MKLLDCLLTNRIPSSLNGSVRATGGPYPEDLEVDDNGYPNDEVVELIPLISMDKADAWLRDEFPALMLQVPYAKVWVKDIGGPRPLKSITVVTGGWSGCESVVWAVLEHQVMKMYLHEEMRGGQYTFVVPAA